MDLAVIVVSYNVRDLTRGCLASVYQDLDRAGLDGRVWVVDNASSDGSAAMVRDEFPQAALIPSATNLGFAGGVNLALGEALSRGAALYAPRHVLLLNPDTIVRPRALPTMVEFLDRHPRAGVVGARLEYGDGTFQHGAFRFPTLAMAALDFWPLNHRLTNSRLNGRYPRRLYDTGQPFAIDHPLGAAFMARREALESVGPLDEGYFMYCEEVDWCLRARRAGWEAYCVPGARVVHLAGQSAGQFRERMFVALWESRFRLFRTHYSPAYVWAARRIVRAGMRREIRRARRAQRAGALSAEDAARRVAAYQRVMEL